MFIEKITKKAHKVEALLLRTFYNLFIKSFEEKIIFLTKYNVEVTRQNHKRKA